MGVHRSDSTATLLTEHDAATGAVFATNPGNTEFAGQVAVLNLTPRAAESTADRNEFVGRNATLECPAAMTGNQRLSGRTGAGPDPCGVLRPVLVIAPHSRVEVTASLGAAMDRDHARALLRGSARADLDGVMRAMKTAIARLPDASSSRRPTAVSTSCWAAGSDTGPSRRLPAVVAQCAL